MKQYKEYKDSGVKWIGTIPSYWKRMRYKDIFQILDEKVGTIKDLTLLSLTKKGVIIRDLSEGKGKFPKDFESYKIVHPNNLILCLFDVDETPRTVGVSNTEGMITGAYDIFSVKNALLDYVYYLYLSFDDKKCLKPLYKGLRKVIPLPVLLSSYIYLPLEQEQQAIVSYLDNKVSKIDKYISTAEKKIVALDELKQVTIADAVTHGITPNAPMKDSEIPWIGMVPKHWKIKTLRAYIQIYSEKNHAEKQLLSVTREQGVILRDVDSKEENHNFIPDDLSGYKLVRRGDFAINKMKSWQGSYGVSNYEGIVSPAYYVCKLKFENKDFFSKSIRCKAYVPFFNQYSKGIRVDQWDLSPIALKNISFFEPPISEQNEIVAYIDRKVAQIDKMKAAELAQIDKLKEYKQRLISDVVTGKVKVTNE